MAWYIVFRKSKAADVAIFDSKKAKSKYCKGAPFEQYPDKDVCINRAKQLGYTFVVVVDDLAIQSGGVSKSGLPKSPQRNRAKDFSHIKKPAPYGKPVDNYEKYLESAHWREIREIRLAIDNHTCQKCGATTNLHVHHKTYARIGDEEFDDLITLCADCHNSVHQKKNKIIEKGKKRKSKRFAKSD